MTPSPGTASRDAGLPWRSEPATPAVVPEVFASSSGFSFLDSQPPAADSTPGRSLRHVVQVLPGLAPGRRSLRRHLLLWLLLPQLVLWAAAAWFTYNLASRYANVVGDRALVQSTRALARQVKPVGSGLLIDLPRAARDILETDSDDSVFYMVSSPPGEFLVGNRKLPSPPDRIELLPDQPALYDVTLDARPMRAAVLALDYGGPAGPTQHMLVQVARGMASQQALARNLMVDTALPLSVLVALMSLIVWAGIVAGLAPLGRLREAVKGVAPGELKPIEIDQAPQEVRDLARATNGLLAAIHENVSAQRRFISDAAHQLRTPLAGLKGQSELALKELHLGATQAELAERLERVNEGATRSAHLVSQLLTLARAEPEAQATRELEPVDLMQLGRDATADMVPRALQAGIDLGLEVPAGSDGTAPIGVAWVMGHPLLLREALVNLIDNAIRYAGRDASVTVRVVPAPDEVTLEVDDDGPGLPPGPPERLFDRFVRGTHAGSGCGLGLAIVREIIARHEGQVELLPRQPRGVRARLSVPRRRRLT